MSLLFNGQQCAPVDSCWNKKIRRCFACWVFSRELALIVKHCDKSLDVKVVDVTRLTSCAGMTCHARREFFCPKLQHFLSVLSIFKCNPGETNDMMNLLRFNNFYPVTAYRRVQKIKKATILFYTVRSLVMVREPVASAMGWKADLSM